MITKDEMDDINQRFKDRIGQPHPCLISDGNYIKTMIADDPGYLGPILDKIKAEESEHGNKTK